MRCCLSSGVPRDYSRMAKIVDITGENFGRLTVLGRAKTPVDASASNQRGLHWRCLCQCGKEAVVLGRYLREYRTLSCGCAANSHQLRMANPKRRQKATCIGAGCEEEATHHGKTYCSKHYWRFRKYGDPDKVLSPKDRQQVRIEAATRRKKPLPKCSIPSCKNSARHDGRTLCCTHWTIKKKYGDPYFVPLRGNPNHRKAKECQ